MRIGKRIIWMVLLVAQGFTLVALALVSFPVFPKDPYSEDNHITVRVLDYVNLPADARREFEANAKRILSIAGIALDFVECYSGGVAMADPACIGPLGPADLMLRIFQPSFAAKGKQLGYKRAACCSTQPKAGRCGWH